MNPQSAYSHRTTRLYENNENNVFDFEALVIDCFPIDGGYGVELDRTAFFPEGGGQYCDTGIIDSNGLSAQVSYVGITDGRILHTSDKPLRIGDKIKASIDTEKRRRRMQNHSGEHIISGLLHSVYGIENAGFHMTEGEINEITIDTTAPLDRAMLDRIEKMANRAVLDNRLIKCYYPSPEELVSIEYRSKTELEGEIRLVEIEGIDICACCAPHVARTGEIGPIHIKSYMKYKRGTRITVVCGEDALDYFRTVAAASSDIARLYSTRPEEAYSAVLRREEYIKEKLAELYSVRQRNLEYRLSEIKEKITDRSESICIFEEGCDAGLMRKLANDGMTLTDGCFAVFSRDGDAFRYTVASEHRDLSELSALIRSRLGGKGGGKGNMITGLCTASHEEILEFFKGITL